MLSAGYDGRYIDAGISIIGVGFILGIKDRKFRFKADPPGYFGYEVAVDFGQIAIDLGQVFQDIFEMVMECTRYMKMMI